MPTMIVVMKVAPYKHSNSSNVATKFYDAKDNHNKSWL